MLDKLRLSSSRALLFNVLPSIRFIFVKLKGHQLILSVYSDRALIKEEEDIYFSVCGEISGDFENIDESVSEVKFYVTNYCFEDIDEEGELIYARYE